MALLPAVFGILLSNDQSQVLLVKRLDVPVWTLPGGGIDPNETAENATMREIQEETGLRISILRKCAEYFPVNSLASFTTLFLCKIESGHPRLSNETSAIQFFPISKLPKNLFHPHKHWLEECLQSPSLIQRPLYEISYWKFFCHFVFHPWQTTRFLWTKFKQK